MSKKNFLYRYICFFLIFFFFIYIYSFYNLYYSKYTIMDDNDVSKTPFITSPSTISTKGYAWPVPGCSRITSYFGYRTASSVVSAYHSGLDIGAPAGTYFVAITDGQIIHTGWTGAGGYTITLVSEEIRVSYCHVSPNFIVHTGKKVSRGDIIGQIGPKNVYTIPNNPYKDSNGNPTNGSTTGPHLHLSIRKDGTAVNPLDYISPSSSS